MAEEARRPGIAHPGYILRLPIPILDGFPDWWGCRPGSKGTEAELIQLYIHKNKALQNYLGGLKVDPMSPLIFVGLEPDEKGYYVI